MAALIRQKIKFVFHRAVVLGDFSWNFFLADIFLLRLLFFLQALAGLPMNAIAIGCLTLAINTWGKPMYDLDTFPEILKNTTGTA